MTTDSQDVFHRLDAEKERHLEELKDFLRIPSISTDPAHAGDMERCSRFVEEQLRRAGLDAEQISSESNPPLVYGEWLGAPGKPTVLIYGHYDVQPVDPLDEWRHPPFEPAIEGEALVARGTTDDKGQLFCHLKALEAILAERGALPVNVKVVIEGEEESGGDSVDRFVHANADRLACDAVVISDSIMLPDQPILVSGARGMVMMELIARGPNRDLHSGEFGGAVANPLNALCWIVGQLVDRETGRITVPGFYEDVLALSEGELVELAQMPFDETDYQRDLGIGGLFGEHGFSTVERAATRPTCDLHGIWGGYQGPGSKTVLPATVGAKLSTRLVPDQDPARVFAQFRDFFQGLDLPGVELELRLLADARPWRLDAEGPMVEAAMAAMAEVWDKPPLRARGGGSLPVLTTFSEVLGAPVLLLGFGLPDDRPHSPNEKLELPQFYGGIRSSVRVLDRIGDLY